jgi:putative DNA primase/helicase
MLASDFLSLYDAAATADGKNAWLITCPIHQSKTQDLRIIVRNGVICPLCKAGCDLIQILQARSLTVDDLQISQNGNGHQPPITTPPPSPPPPVQPQPTATPTQKDYNTTDMGNAERFYDLHGANIRYCADLGKDGAWLVWDGRRWKVDRTLRIHTLAKQVVPLIYQDAANALTKPAKKRLFNWAVKTESLATRGNMIRDARHLSAIEITELDKNPWLLNLRNGTLDLKTGILAPHSQADKITRLIDIDFNPVAECPLWIEFLISCMAGNQDLVSYLQKIVGYTLTGDVSEKCVFIMHGPKDTGKTTFVETIRLLTGEYAVKIQAQTLMWQRERNNTNDVARLKGARFVYASESEENERLAESRIKEMSGGDTLVARFLHAEFFEFDQEFKIWLATNNKPRVSNDEATWGRLKLLPFVAVIPEAKKDKQLKNKLRAELPGILRWAIDGCLMWQRDGLQHPDQIVAATQDYHKQMDIIGMFVDECCEVGELFRARAKTVYDEYKTWCLDNGEKIESQRAMTFKLRSKNVDSEQITSGPYKGSKEYVGIRLKQTP